jgi:alkylhydroperoxidase/carboxymuconolactone decarboxylase family protein YurZ
MKLQGMNPRLRELVALAVLAAFGCGLALSQGDLLLVAIFGVRRDNYRGDTSLR